MVLLSDSSLKHRSMLDPELQAWVDRLALWAPPEMDFKLTDSFRDEAAQNAAFAAGTSTKKWGGSKHNVYPSLAVDLAPWPIDWKNTARFERLGGFGLATAAALGIKLRWGGFWRNWVDRPHFELIR